jgi:hypothetical protein
LYVALAVLLIPEPAFEIASELVDYGSTLAATAEIVHEVQATTQRNFAEADTVSMAVPCGVDQAVASALGDAGWEQRSVAGRNRLAPNSLTALVPVRCASYAAEIAVVAAETVASLIETVVAVVVDIGAVVAEIAVAETAVTVAVVETAVATAGAAAVETVVAAAAETVVAVPAAADSDRISSGSSAHMIQSNKLGVVVFAVAAGSAVERRAELTVAEVDMLDTAVENVEHTELDFVVLWAELEPLGFVVESGVPSLSFYQTDFSLGSALAVGLGFALVVEPAVPLFVEIVELPQTIASGREELVEVDSLVRDCSLP